MDAPGSGHRMRVALNKATSQSSRLQDELQLNKSIEVGQEMAGSTSPGQKRKKGDATSDEAISDTGRSRRTQATQMDAAADELDGLSEISIEQQSLEKKISSS